MIKFHTKNEVVQASVDHEFIYQESLVQMNATAK